jgi:glycosyltransferase involved in cell wall biosynthesis
MPASTPILSIGVPVFNGEPYITQSLASILGQTFTNFEVIVSDNASTDGTGDICRSHEVRDKRIRYSRNSTNIGLLLNFRRVLDLATGKYFMWAACDDYWSPNYVETLLACLQQHPEAVLAAGRIHFVDPSGLERTDILPDDPPAPGMRPHVDTAKQLLSQNAFGWLHGVFRREALIRLSGRFFRDSEWGSDVVFLLELCLGHTLVGSRDAVMHKRMIPGKGPRTPRELARWHCWFASALIRVIRESPRSRIEKAELLETALRYLRGLYFSDGFFPTMVGWARAGYHVLLGVDRP